MEIFLNYLPEIINVLISGVALFIAIFKKKKVDTTTVEQLQEKAQAYFEKLCKKHNLDSTTATNTTTDTTTTTSTSLIVKE